MLVQILATAALALFLWSLLRFALGLRAAKTAREAERRAQEAAGRRVVAELPLEQSVVLLLEDGDGFYWADREVRKEHLRGARLLLNDAVLAAFSGGGRSLPPPPVPDPDDDDGRERWSVRLYLDGGVHADIPCGRLREGVSREAARQVFEALRAACASPSAPAV